MSRPVLFTDVLCVHCMQLCSQCRLQPVAYLQYKQQLVSECKKEGKVRLADARKLIKIDVNKTRRIYNLLVEKGLVVK